jgi:hypothetical protein
MNDLQRLRDLEAKATPGPWTARRSIFPPADKINYAYVSFGKDSGESGLGTGTLSEADARFLAVAIKFVRATLRSGALIESGEPASEPLTPVEGPRAVCPTCGTELLGVGTIGHNDDGSHSWTPGDGRAQIEAAIGRRLNKREWSAIAPLLAASLPAPAPDLRDEDER